ncbi:MAG: VOC family protein [Acidobacteriota bacterium]
MPKFSGHAPVLLVNDVQRSADFYRDQLGFGYDRIWGEPPCFAIVRRDGLHMMLSQVPAGDPVDTQFRASEGVWNAYFWVDNARALHDEWAAAGVTIVCPPAKMIYGQLEFTIRDLDGHAIGIGQPIESGE